jgi:hypothetical protein
MENLFKVDMRVPFITFILVSNNIQKSYYIPRAN